MVNPDKSHMIRAVVGCGVAAAACFIGSVLTMNPRLVLVLVWSGVLLVILLVAMVADDDTDIDGNQRRG